MWRGMQIGVCVLLQFALVVSRSSAFIGKKNSNGFRSHHHRKSIICHQRRSQTCLHVVRRPLRPASTEKKRAERRAIIEYRQNEARLDHTLLTNLSFSECKELHPSSKRALVEDMGLQTMTEVQAKTFAAALLGKDILARARTGWVVKLLIKYYIFYFILTN